MELKKEFMTMHPELMPVECDNIHKELHKLNKNIYVFINMHRNVVELHDTSILIKDDFYPSHLMTEQFVTDKIWHDAMKYNNEVFNISDFLDNEEVLEDHSDEVRYAQQRNSLVEQSRKILYKD